MFGERSRHVACQRRYGPVSGINRDRRGRRGRRPGADQRRLAEPGVGDDRGKPAAEDLSDESLEAGSRQDEAGRRHDVVVRHGRHGLSGSLVLAARVTVR
jgi:hypothetical protein